MSDQVNINISLKATENCLSYFYEKILGLTRKPQCTPFIVGWTYKGHHFQIKLEKQKKASISGMTIRNGAAKIFIP